MSESCATWPRTATLRPKTRRHDNRPPAAASHATAAACFGISWLLGRLHRAPVGAFPVTPMVHAGIPYDLSPRRPRRRWGRWSRPWRSPVAGRAAIVVVPVTAVVPVLVRAPARIPLFARAPVVVIDGCRRRRRRGDAGGQSEGGHGQAAGRDNAGAQPGPRSCWCVGIHAAGISLDNAGETRFRRLLVSNFEHSQHISSAKGFVIYELFMGLFLTPGDDIAGRAHHFADGFPICGRSLASAPRSCLFRGNSRPGLRAAPAAGAAKIVIPATITGVARPAPGPECRGDPRRRDTCAPIGRGQAAAVIGRRGGATRSGTLPLIKPWQ